MIENVLFSKLSEIGYSDTATTRIYPTTPKTNTELPFIVYTVTAAEPTPTLAGNVGNLTNYTVQIDMYAENLSSVQTMLSDTRDELHCWMSSDVAGAFLTSSATSEEEYGYYGVQTYTVWGRV